MTADRVVVIGGGLAGISAAIELAEGGLPVTLLESRPWLGGATWSFGRRGLTIDNGQHAFLRCFSAYQDLLIRLGVSEAVNLQDRLDLTVLAGGGPQQFRRTSWPAPLHLAKTLASYGLLSPGERLGVVPAVMTIWLGDLSRQRRASVAEWLGRYGQGEHARREFWEVFLVPVLNAVPEQSDLATAAGVINLALLNGRDRADIGISSVPLRDLHGGPACRRLARLGAEVRLSTRALAVSSRRGGGFSVRADSLAGDSRAPGASFGEPGGDEIHAAGVVLAVPAWSAAELAPAELSADVNAWRKLTPSPLLSIHVMYDSTVTRLPFAASGESALRWIVDKTGSAGLHTGQYLAASIPAADKFVDAPSAAIRDEFLPVLERLLPAAASAGVDDFFVTRERSATFRPVPGSAAFRPDQVTNLPGFALAGAWTSTGWPDTMEGAVRSGRRAAEWVLRALSQSEASTAELHRPQPRVRIAAAVLRSVAAMLVSEPSGPVVTSAPWPGAVPSGGTDNGGARTSGEVPRVGGPETPQAAGSAVPAEVKPAASASEPATKEPIALAAPDAVPERAKAAGQ